MPVSPRPVRTIPPNRGFVKLVVQVSTIQLVNYVQIPVCNKLIIIFYF